jgi:hypothetical protein
LRLKQILFWRKLDQCVFVTQNNIELSSIDLAYSNQI